MLRSIVLAALLVPVLFASKPVFSDDLQTYTVSFSVKKDLDKAITVVSDLLTANNITMDGVERDFTLNKGAVFIIAGESVRNSLDLFFKNNQSLFPSDLVFDSISTKADWVKTKPLNFVIDFSTKSNLDDSVKFVKDVLSKASINVWGNVAFNDQGRGIVFIRLSAGEDCSKVLAVLTSQDGIPLGFTINSISEYEVWWASN